MTHWEREFLKLADVWIETRWCVMGNHITDRYGRIVHRGACDMDSLGCQLLGMLDYAAEMRLECRGLLAAPRETTA
jgi:hypothetical protein